MKRVLVLGAGLVGRHITLDLSYGDFEVSCVDASDVHDFFTGSKVKFNIWNAHPNNINTLIKDKFDIVVNALPGSIGFNILEAVIKTGTNVVDIAFYPEDPLQLDDLAREHGVTAIVDFGVAPGICGAILGYEQSKMGEIESFRTLVGGLPKERTYPFNYKAPFSPSDVLEEYTRPARYVENGHLIIKPALSDPEMINFDGIGTLEAFNTDGLRTLITTMPDVPNMIEKTMRFPGHIDLMRALREAGFLDKQVMQFGDAEISPLDFTSRILFPQWKLKEGDIEFTVMRVEVEGKNVKATYDLLDWYDEESETPSMARTTGYACAAAVNLLANGYFSEPGIYPPEFIGADEEAMEEIFDYMAERGVVYTCNIEEIDEE